MARGPCHSMILAQVVEMNPQEGNSVVSQNLKKIIELVSLMRVKEVLLEEVICCFGM